jgi:hypothetical protein
MDIVGSRVQCPVCDNWTNKRPCISCGFNFERSVYNIHIKVNEKMQEAVHKAISQLTMYAPMTYTNSESFKYLTKLSDKIWEAREERIRGCIDA